MRKILALKRVVAVVSYCSSTLDTGSMHTIVVVVKYCGSTLRAGSMRKMSDEGNGVLHTNATCRMRAHARDSSADLD